MFRPRTQIDVNPLDRKKNTGIGVSIPFNGRAVFNTTYATKDQIQSNIINLLLTNTGERVFNPNFGGDIRTMLFEQDTSFENIKEKIAAVIEAYFAQVSVKDVTLTKKSDENTMSISIQYQVTDIEQNISIDFNA
jgi:phage baseplate assembly protein W